MLGRETCKCLYELRGVGVLWDERGRSVGRRGVGVLA